MFGNNDRNLNSDNHAGTLKPVAIVGISCFLPSAQTPDKFWSNTLQNIDCSREIPLSRFDWRPYYSERWKSGLIDSRWGCFVDPISFNPLLFGIPPNSLPSISASQVLALEASRLALCDAGYSSVVAQANNAAVVFGASTTADLYHRFVANSIFDPDLPSRADRLFSEWTSDTYPGILVNVISGRIANRFNCTGLNFTVDAACASSLAALRIAMQELHAGNSDLAIAGAIDLDQTLYSYQAFSSARALSPTGRCRPFDERANGTVLSEGVVVLILKRLEDALQHGDKIYACIRSVESASDGRGLSLTAPNSTGQQLAITKAFRRAGVHPNQMTLYEAHGTGTVLGDKTELATLRSILRTAGRASCTISSAKGAIGHTKACAGMVGILKTALALYHGVLPPMLGTEEALPELKEASSPLCFLREPQPWVETKGGTRIAGVSAFGFGGINYHAVMEAPPHSPSHYRPHIDSWPHGLRSSDTTWVVQDGHVEQTAGVQISGSLISECEPITRPVNSDVPPATEPHTIPSITLRKEAPSEQFPSTQYRSSDRASAKASPIEPCTTRAHTQNRHSSGDVKTQELHKECYATLTDLITSTITRITGYPRTSISPTANISADLGIDSLGMVEILESIGESADSAVADYINRDFDNLCDCDTVSDLLAQIEFGIRSVELTDRMPTSHSPSDGENPA
jgi:acyl transferase domain-containing protein